MKGVSDIDNARICRGCNLSKPYTEEYYEKGRNYCRDCRSQQAKKRQETKMSADIILYKCNQMAYSAYSRVFAPSREYKTNYRSLINPYDFKEPKEMCEYLYNNFYDDIKTLLDRGVSPSVDRIDSSMGYSKENIRIISHKKNTELGLTNRRRKVKMITPNDEIIIFNSTVECVGYFGYDNKSSSRVAHWIRRCSGEKGDYKVPEGYHFEYIDNN